MLSSRPTHSAGDFFTKELVARCAQAETENELLRAKLEIAARKIQALERASIRELPTRYLDMRPPIGQLEHSHTISEVLRTGHLGELQAYSSQTDEERELRNAPLPHTVSVDAVVAMLRRLIVVTTRDDRQYRCSTARASIIVGSLDPLPRNSNEL